jgi:glycosyltransferase involved in cell wall biosynthesis
VLLDATAVQALAQGLWRLVSDDDLRLRLAAAGKRRAASLTWAATAQRTMALYDDLT